MSPSKGAPVKAFFGDEVKGKPIARFVPPALRAKDLNNNFDFTELKDLLYIASGEFANVYSGNWRGIRVAVKILKEEVRILEQQLVLALYLSIFFRPRALITNRPPFSISWTIEHKETSLLR